MIELLIAVDVMRYIWILNCPVHLLNIGVLKSIIKIGQDQVYTTIKQIPRDHCLR